MVASLDEFFNLMAQERKFHLETSEDPTLAEMGELYGKLMGDAENVASFRGRVDSIFSHLVSGRYDAEPGRLLHGLWLANAYARYLCFRLQDLPGSLRVTEAMLGLSSKLMSVQYEGYDLAAKCFPLILVLNVARLHGYAGNVEYCRDLLDDLENYVDDSGENASFSRYPDFVQNTMRTFSLRMAICLTSENRIYFKRKIQAERVRFQGSAQPTDLLHSFFLIVVCRKDSVFVCVAERAIGWTWS
ncbi:MAG: hypothetical protein RBT63_11100, partial [Bdellovibrionales bacterium]|nr:hypothetical protein [Bdellovibrionales bacterium]